MRWTVLCVLALLTLVRPVMAQPSGTVTGLVTNALSNEPMPGVTVVVESTGLSRQARTDAEGKYTVQVPPGAYHVLVRVNQFLPFRQEVTVAAGPQTVDVYMAPELHFSEVTSVSPQGRNQFETFQATNVLGGQELTKALQGTLGATLETEPGIAVRSFGAAPARPVIRGLDGDRVLIVEDGMRMGDLSSQSGDHGVNVNPAAAASIEIVRGPATLLYGANAIGGLVNVITNDVPRAPVKRPTGSFTLDAASGAPGGGGAGDVTVGNGRFALHASGSGRGAQDTRTPDGPLANSFSRAGAAEVGAAYTAESGYLGASYGWDRTRYGIPLIEDGQTNLDPRRHSLTVRGESRTKRGIFDGLKGSLGVRRYRHDERDGDTVATAFTNNTSEVNLLAHHQRLGRLTGSIGGSWLTRRFLVAGEEVLAPAVSQRGGSVYLYEELAASPHVQLQFGTRVERASFDPDAGERARAFTNVSASVGALLHPTEQTTVAFSLASAARNPALEELYFHGPHPGTAAVENGDPSLRSERALGFDTSLRWRNTVATGEVTLFVNQINDFVFRRYTGVFDLEAGLPDTVFTQADARLVGIESHADLKVGPLVWLEGGLDYVRGSFLGSGGALPRTPPLRGRAGVRVQRNALQADIEATFTAAQDRVYTITSASGPVGETRSDGYGLLKASAAYSFGSDKVLSTVTFRLDNAANARYRNHLNYLKDLTPEMGRNASVVYNVKF
ncbi:MAG: TonB-dependent receptor [Vicinamibacterales bacterium]|nr:TonB-dependent receptor [Vicinamibacterales bacterium]